MEVRYPPLKRGISAIPARYPMKTRQMGAIPPSAILSRKGIARYGGGISHWAAKLLSAPPPYSEEVFASQERVSGFPEKGADLRGSPGNLRGSSGNFRGSLGNFRGTPGVLLSYTVREPPGKSPKNFRGSLGNFRGSPGTSQKLGVA